VNLDTMMSLAKLGYEYQVNAASAHAPSVSLSQYENLCSLLAQTRSLYDTMAAQEMGRTVRRELQG